MKPFNLEQALAGAPVVTRCGIPVYQMFYFSEAVDSFYKLHAVVEGEIYGYTDAGTFHLGRDHEIDLLMGEV